MVSLHSRGLRPERHGCLPASPNVIDVYAQYARRVRGIGEKTLRNYVAVVALGCALLWLRI